MAAVDAQWGAAPTAAGHIVAVAATAAGAGAGGLLGCAGTDRCVWPSGAGCHNGKALRWVVGAGSWSVLALLLTQQQQCS